MSTFADSYVSRVLFASPAPGSWARRRRLTTSLFDPYRPEPHYMGGPGPNWRAKHARGAGYVSQEPLKPNHQRVNRGTRRDGPRL
jgi:hypothetical protein